MQSITEEMIDASIKTVQYHHFPGTQLVMCCVTLVNGFSVLGTATAHDPSAFDIKIGKDIAREQARDKIAPLLAYAIRERLHLAKMPEIRSSEAQRFFQALSRGEENLKELGWEKVQDSDPPFD